MSEIQCPRCKGSGLANPPRRKIQGSLNGMSKLNESKVRQIRALAKDLSVYELANRFGVSGSTISGVLSYRTWAHVDVDYNDAPAID